jgi:hypothetical protein
LVEPEATDHVTAAPWLHFPPGALMLLIACASILMMAAFQSSVNIVRRDGLRDGIREELADTIPLEILEQPIARPAAEGAHRRVRRHHTVRLHRLLETTNATPWSLATGSAVAPLPAAPIAQAAPTADQFER